MTRSAFAWFLGVAFIFGFPSIAASVVNDEPWRKVLAEFVDDNGWVDYAGLKETPQNLEAYVSGLAQWGPSLAPKVFTSRQDSFAFWLNAYNAFVIYGVTQSYPVNSVTEILPEFGFFKEKTFQIDGRRLTLDEIEHTILRSQFQDPRIHAAVNCAAASCPKLANKPFTATGLDSQLEVGMRHMILSPQHVFFDASTQTLHLSRIFEWFESDFTDWVKRQDPQESPRVVDYIGMYLPPDQRKALPNVTVKKIHFREYDWSLNDQSKLR